MPCLSTSTEQPDLTRRDAAKLAVGATAAAAIIGAPWIQKVKAANSQVQMAIIGTGGRGQYHITHLNGLDGGRLLASCDIYQPNLDKGVNGSKDKPKGYKDYREVLNRNDIDAVIIATPLSTHFPITRDALLAGKHVFCEKSLVHKPEEIHMLRKMVNERPKQVLQVGLRAPLLPLLSNRPPNGQKGLLGDVTNVYSQWRRATSSTSPAKPGR